MNTIDEKYEALKARISELGKVCIAFSGGVDSTLLLYTASKLVPTLALTVEGIMQPESEKRFSEDFSKTLECEHSILSFNPLEIEAFRENTPDRCYYCKREIFGKIKDFAASKGYYHVLDGTNLDDLSDYRPGLRAIEELGIKSPFLDVGLTKSDIYYLSKKYDLPTKNKSAAACLASRIPTGETITGEKLKKVEKAESFLNSLGFSNLRLRLREGRLGTIECSVEDFKIYKENSQKIKEELRKLGIELTGEPRAYKRGSMNKT